jgi:hypothetical protein
MLILAGRSKKPAEFEAALSVLGGGTETGILSSCPGLTKRALSMASRLVLPYRRSSKASAVFAISLL